MRPVLFIAALTVLAACDTVPKPFRHEDGVISALARPKLGRGIALRPSDDLGQSDILMAAVIQAFEDREVPVTLRHGPGFGRVIEASPEGHAAQGQGIVWRLLAADGSEMNRLVTTPATLAKLAAAQVAAQFYPLLEDPDAKPQIAAGTTLPPRPVVRIEPMKGLPGDGDTVLPQALAKALGRERIDVTDTAPYTVVGVVSVAPSGANEDTVTISWLVKRGGAGGAQLARIDQGGAVPRGRLNLTWGSMARDIAEGGASGVAEVVRLAERNRQEQESAAGSRQFTEAGPADIGKPELSDQTNSAPTPSPMPSEPAPSAVAGPSEAPSPASPATPDTAEPAPPKPVKAVVKPKSSAKSSPKPTKAQKAQTAPRIKTDR
ncbi:hypothetical protein [Magnetospirillum sulfuroxidans]|uniref:hypothetical protein n=1 Tax=Magnetospirillum sulfuroxidans TaxID=611300 RepID=UPI001B8AFF47|nr:hypothetical protein [Magnetospirillum sulfuroxidans]